MTDNQILFSMETSSSGKLPQEQSTGQTIQRFEYDWYIRVKVELQDSTELYGGKRFAEIEARVHTLSESILFGTPPI